MIPVNELLNRINDWQLTDQNAFKRHVSSRITNLCATAPIEAIAIAQNIIIAPFQAAGIVLNAGTRVISVISSSQAIKDLQDSLPNLKDLMGTIVKIVGYAIGTVFTATLGVISPSANFKVQCAFGLAIDLRDEAIKIALEEEEKEKSNQLAAAQREIERIAEENLAAQNELNNLAVVYEIANKENEENDNLEAASQMFVNAEVAAAASEERTPVQTPSVEIEQEEIIENETIRDLEETNEVEDEAEDDYMVFEHNEDTALTRFVQGTLNAGSTVASNGYNAAKYVVGGAVDTSKRVFNYVSSFFSFEQNVV